MIGSSETVEAVNQLRLIPELIDERALKVMDRLKRPATRGGWSAVCGIICCAARL